MSCCSLSFCIPTYNRPDELLCAISSIIDQKNGFDYEIVISDNSENDHTKRLMERFIDNPKIRYHKNINNIGSAANFAKVISLAGGKYVWLMSDDDTLHTGAMHRLNNLLEQQDSLKYIFATRFLCAKDLDYTSGTLQPLGLDNNAVFSTGQELFSALDGQMPGLMGFISSTIIYKELWDKSFALVGTPFGNWSHLRVILHAIKDKPCAILSGINVLACSTPSQSSIDSTIWIDQIVKLMKLAEQWGYNSNLCWKLIGNSYHEYAKMYVLDKAHGKRKGNLFSLIKQHGCRKRVKINWPWFLISMLPRKILLPMPWLKIKRRELINYFSNDAIN